MLAMQFKLNKMAKILTSNPLLIEINHALEDKNHQVSWQRLNEPDDAIEDVYREFIICKLKITVLIIT